MTDQPLQLVVAGVRLAGAGYPNATRTLQALQAREGIHVVDCGRSLPEAFRLWQLAQAEKGKQLWILARLAFGNFRSGLVALRQARKWRAPIYVPYPAVPLLWLYSLLPRRIRPRLVADAYISLWDSLVVDRHGARTDGRFAKWLRIVEGRALRTADVVLTDTQANREYLLDIFAIDAARIRSIPLAIVEPAASEIAASAIRKAHDPLEVLFLGTLVPLHGIRNLLLGIAPLVHDPRFNFTFIGEGQDAEQVERFQQQHPDANVHWIREWQKPEELARQILSADVCLGVFGGAGKASRVLPFKVYLYLAHGRAVITQGAMSLPAGVPLPPVLTVDPESPEQITEALRFLRENPPAVARLQDDALQFYRAHLSNARVADVWTSLLQELARKRGGKAPPAG